MSLTSLSSSFANTYVNAPASAAQPKGAAGTTDGLKALADYIPSEIVTLYIAAVAAVVNWHFAVKSDEAIYLAWIFWICLAVTPVWVFFSVLLQSNSRPNWKAFLWPMIAAASAFAAYAYAIPGSWLAASHANGGLFATILLLISPVVLHSVTLVYTKLLPP